MIQFLLITPGVDSTDEQCGFELLSRKVLIGASDPNQTFSRLSFVRNALKEGLLQEQMLGVNPFRLGIVASTDTHNGDPGNVREDSYVGHTGVNDDSPAHNQLNLTSNNGWNGENSPAGLAVVWAEENSRDALFSAMRRRETYGTSGPRLNSLAVTGADNCQAKTRQRNVRVRNGKLRFVGKKQV